MLKRISFLLTLALLVGQLVMAQVTTSSITGTVRDNGGQPLVGATVSAVHNPSGTSYTTLSRNDGVFSLPNLRIGGPYTLTINYVGLQPYTADGITLQLGQPYNVNATMGENVQALETVVVTGSRGRRAATERTGASTNINSRQLTTLPTISRSINDFTRLTPQANGNNFGGRDARYNNVQVDGANLNNNFGLSSDPLPGGGNNPISIDAIEEITVNIAPFDVRQANFTGAGISAVTKSGTNTFRGSAYTLYRDQSFNGMRAAGTKLSPLQTSKNNIYGLTLGGPIVKNKLFFFVSGEYEKRTFPGIQFSPTGGSGNGNISATPIDSLRKLSDFLRNTYGYETGAFDNFPGFAAENYKLLGKLDWNISNANKLTLKYSELVSNNDVSLNALSVPNNAASTGFQSVARFGNQAFSFENSNYGFQDVVRSGTLELNSRFRNKFANQFLATLTKTSATRTSPSQVFPFIDILGPNPGSNNNYMSVGYEPYSYNNDVVNDVYNITNNFSYFAGKHTITAGGSYEYQRVGNMFMAASQSYYVFNSLNDFITNQAPRAFALTYSLLPGQDAVYSANLKIGQLGFYAQDEINVSPALRITAGIRVDRPTYPEQPLENPAISALSLYNEEGGLTNYTTGAWPKSSWYWSPRVGFRYNMEQERLIVRGGTGVFTGRIPFVYLTNIPTGSNMYQVGALVSSATQLQNFRFNPDPRAYNPFYNTALNTTYPTIFPITAGAAVPTSAYALTSSDFRFPQVWRTNLAVDKQLGRNWGLTLEALYTKDINAVYMFNANQRQPDATVTTGPFVRPRFSSSAARKLNASSGNAIVLANTDLGSAFSFTTQVNKAFTSGFYGSLAYTYTFAQDVTANPGSQANSVWSVNATSRTQNDLELSYSNFAVPHRIVGNVSYRKEYLKFLATTISFFYEGAHQGNYSYIYNGDLNNDGNTGADLMYVPRNPSEIQFANLNASGSTPAFTAAQQSEAFFRYIAQDPYLSKNMGQIVERNGAKLPFYHRLDMRFVQDVFKNFGGRRNTLQFTADVTNFLNMLNNDWGARKLTVVNNPLRVQSVSSAGVPTYTLATYTPRGGTPQLVDRTFINNIGTASTWSLQLGVRYIF